MIITLIGQILSLTALTLFGITLNKFLKIEITLACVLTGLLAGFGITYIDFDTGLRASNLKDIVFFIILPVLIFEAAWQLNINILKKWLAPILLLAIAGVATSGLIMGGLIYFGISHTSFPWIAALLTGAILSATDPVAVNAQLKALKVSEDLTTLFEGESLFNDATAVVMFTIIISYALSPLNQVTNTTSFFSMVFFGGLLIGVVIGILSSAFILVIRNPTVTQLTLVFTAFSSFYFAEHVLHVSGVLSVMMTAISLRLLLNKAESTIIEGVHTTWDWLGLYFNSLLFVMMGLTITVAMFRSMWLAMIIAIISALIARYVAVTLCCTLSKPLRPVPISWQILLTWGGLRGAIAIALVLSLPVELPYWWTIQSMVFGVVTFSTLVQSTTIPLLTKQLKIL